MSIFDLQKGDLLQLSDKQLEELIARLAEAELESHGQSRKNISWSGSLTTPDSGIDVHVQAPKENFREEFIPRSDTIFQVKKSSMPAGKITKEMCPKGKLSSTLSAQASKGGSYIIVSLKDDCAPPEYQKRKVALENAVKDDPNASQLHLDFYDRSKILQWLRGHPAVMLWIRQILGKSLSGWEPYGRWSRTPANVVDDTLIIASGISVLLPNGEKLNLEHALTPMCNLVRSGEKAIRIVGLSGVGKTRIIQALFEDNAGNQPLDRTITIYADIGAAPDTTAHKMLDILVAENRKAILVLDNCSSQLHSDLVKKITSIKSKPEISLVTVEYDIKEDKPETTDVIHIQADGTETVEALLHRRFPKIGQLNAHRIAEFSGGNARIAIAIADTAESNESLVHLSDKNLFDRLFEQRNPSDNTLREDAELFSLVYSFSINEPIDNSDDIDELAILAEFGNSDRRRLYRSVRELLRRGIAQERSHWRAILPQAIAGRLAHEALENIPVCDLKKTFEAPKRERLLISFAHRLSFMHSHPVVQQIAKEWLDKEIFLNISSHPHNSKFHILDYITPIIPNDILEYIRKNIDSNKFLHISRAEIINIIKYLAYEDDKFDRCIDLLLKTVEDNEINDVMNFFQPYLSGTHASIKQRSDTVHRNLHSPKQKRQEIGLEMLSRALDTHEYSGFFPRGFGARVRDFGAELSPEELLAWYNQFIDIAVETATGTDQNLATKARHIIAQRLSTLWPMEAIRGKLIKTAQTLNKHQPWLEGWLTVKAIINDNSQNQKNFTKEIRALEAELKPNYLPDKVKSHLLESDKEIKTVEHISIHTLKIEELGRDYMESGHLLSELGTILFQSPTWISQSSLEGFGRGIAQGSPDLLISWKELVSEFNTLNLSQFNPAIFIGFLSGVERNQAQKLLKFCLEAPQLRPFIFILHPRQGFDETDLERCLKALTYDDVSGQIGYELAFWQKDYAALSASKLVELAEQLLKKPDGDIIILHAISFRYSNISPTDISEPDLLHIGLQAAIKILERTDSKEPYYMVDFLQKALLYSGNDEEKSKWLDAVFVYIKKYFGLIHPFQDTIRATAHILPQKFLTKLFNDKTAIKMSEQIFTSSIVDDTAFFEDTGINIIIKWCQTQNIYTPLDEAWKIIAKGVPVFDKPEKFPLSDGTQSDRKQKDIQLHQKAIKFLEAAPNKEDILRIYARRVKPTSWSGDSRYGIMKDRLFALKTLEHHQDGNILSSIKKILPEWQDYIEKIAAEDEKRFREQEQRFE